MDFVIAKFLHVMSAAIAFGGVAFVLWALMPSAGRIDSEASGKLMESVTVRFSRMIWIAIALLIITGIWMIIVVMTAVPSPLYHSILGIKIILAIVIFTIAIALTLPGKAFQSMKQNRRRWMIINIHLFVIVFFLGVWLGRI